MAIWAESILQRSFRIEPEIGASVCTHCHDHSHYDNLFPNVDQPGTTPCYRDIQNDTILECSVLNCCVFVEDGGESGHLKGGVALTPDLALKRLGGLLRSMFLFELDPVLRGWWLLRLVNASWLEVSSAPKSGPTDGAVLLLRRRRKTCVFDSCGDGSLQQYNRLYPPCVVLLVCVPTMYCYVYKYK
jgi:hypothetical protein